MTKKTAKKTFERRDYAAEVTAKIVEALEAGTRPWVKGWATSGLQRNSQRKAYRGINQFLLGMAAAVHGYQSPYWFGFHGAKDLGFKVRKGEKGTVVIFFKVSEKENAETGETEKRFFMTASHVWNLDQLEPAEEGNQIPPRFVNPEHVPLDPALRNHEAEMALLACGADVRFGGDKAFYSPQQDFVQVPAFESFKTPGSYLATLGHELVHWTGHKDRQARDGIVKFDHFGSPQYAFEELVAELGSAMLNARLGVEGEHIDNHAAYVGGWLKKLGEDKNAILKAARLADAACVSLLGPVDASEASSDDEELPLAA
jgi:antirestriction protein ArdC